LNIKCKTNEKKELRITLDNPYEYQTLTYRVETDIPNFYGPEEIKIPNNSKKDYEFLILPTISGTYLGCITFYE